MAESKIPFKGNLVDMSKIQGRNEANQPQIEITESNGNSISFAVFSNKLHYGYVINGVWSGWILVN